MTFKIQLLYIYNEVIVSGATLARAMFKYTFEYVDTLLLIYSAMSIDVLINHMGFLLYFHYVLAMFHLSVTLAFVRIFTLLILYLIGKGEGE